MPFKIHNILNDFVLPITYVNGDNESSALLDDSIVKDLEIVKLLPNESSIFSEVFSPKTVVDNVIIDHMSAQYTSNKSFLLQTQKILSKKGVFIPVDEHEMTTAVSTWSNIQNETSFHDKYMYLESDWTKRFNRSAPVMQFMSMYNVMSPLISLCLPILVFIVPFIILYLRGIEVSMSEYMTVFKTILQNHSVGRLFTDFSSVNFSQKMYILASVGFYVFSIYQNFLTCKRFYTNIESIHTDILEINSYARSSIKSMKRFLKCAGPKNFPMYKKFGNDVRHHMNTLRNMSTELEKVGKFAVTAKKCSEIGYILKCFYAIYDDKEYTRSMNYSFAFSGYINSMAAIHKHIESNRMSMATFGGHKSLEIKGMVYPAFIYKRGCDRVGNDIIMNKNIVITGPNASGKTTALKSIMLNVLLTQQFGCGCYTSMKINIYDFFHCYLNIPDTLERDSLFQAEARRCLNVINSISKHPKLRHMCIFDELYSGTNPDEAVRSAISFSRYLSESSGVQYALTTHYKELPIYFEQHEKQTDDYSVHNYYMHVDKSSENDFNYTYQIRRGISNVKGGLIVLKEMNYPDKIIDWFEKITIN